ncbi:D-aminopeptidase [Rhizobium sophoriradicis]|uniref:Aminopeptidase n=1 Tax=Rhizobium sophoriradicis TaxID=1535245 RepID=A0A2A5KJM7_9HYPH|nr:D-aminopeptidase [Rhizobium sophoriradicis]PCK77192.1 aminopeptidase [Rhizobium sophoriradicis]
MNIAALEQAVNDLPLTYPGPGGAVAVVKDGVPIVRHGWGFANLETRQPFTTATVTPICSITKQFTCATLLSVAASPYDYDSLIAGQLPRLEGDMPITLDLANNQSGLRDYWAVSVLCGASPEGEFRPSDAVALIGLTRSLHFKPGTAYSYSNGNFRMLASAIERKAGREFGEVLTEMIIEPVGMATASFEPESGAVPGGACGYEGTLTTGWRPGVNNIHWSGDAGLCASIDDLVAWERFIYRTREDTEGLYAKLSQPTYFANGAPASYGLGLAKQSRWGREMTGHGGALRGWRLQRIWVPAERLSVDVVFNHESDSYCAAMHLLAVAMGENDQAEPSHPILAKKFEGAWIDRETGLLLDVLVDPTGTLNARYTGGGEVLSVREDGVAHGVDMTLQLGPGGVRIIRRGDAINSLAVPVIGASNNSHDIAGIYWSAELESELEVKCAGSSWFACFNGFLGSGPLMSLSRAGTDIWRLACQRSLDAPSPGEWTMQIERSVKGKVVGVTFGCWLARKIAFGKTA